MALTNAQHQKLYRMKIREMVLSSPFVRFSKPIPHQCNETRIVWLATRFFSREAYYELTRTYVHESGREYTKTIYVSSAILEKKYADIKQNA